MTRRTGRRGRGVARERTTTTAALAGTGGGDATGVPKQGVSRNELVERIAVRYGVDRDRATAGADLYLLQLRRSSSLGGY